MNRDAAILADVLGEKLAEVAAEMRDRLTKSEEATVSLLLDLEARIAALEQQRAPQPMKPRLIIDAA